MFILNAMKFAWSPETLMPSLLLTLKGMIGIFAVILTIWAFVAILNKVTGKKKNKTILANEFDLTKRLPCKNARAFWHIIFYSPARGSSSLGSLPR